jgi:hypothetical protein
VATAKYPTADSGFSDTSADDDPATAPNPDQIIDLGYSDQTGSFNSAVSGLFVFARPGDTVTVSDGNGMSAMHIISGLTVTAVDATHDTVSGTAAPGSRLMVSAAFHWPKDAANPTEQANRALVADASGHWTADFTTLSSPDDHGTHDIRVGSGIWASQINPDPPFGWPGPGPFPWSLWGAVPQTWILQQLQPVTTQDCKNGGWAYVVDKLQNHFTNQGDCVSYVTTGGKNPAHGGVLSP